MTAGAERKIRNGKCIEPNTIDLVAIRGGRMMKFYVVTPEAQEDLVRDDEIELVSTHRPSSFLTLILLIKWN